MKKKILLLLNLYHLLSAQQIEELNKLLGKVDLMIETIAIQFSESDDYLPQVIELIKKCNDLVNQYGVDPEEVLLIPPAQNFIAVTFIAFWHGFYGFFPAIVRIRKSLGETIPGFEVAEVLNLSDIREIARESRGRL